MNLAVEDAQDVWQGRRKMGLDILFKIAGVGILVSVFHTALKQAGKEDMAHLCTLAGFTIVLLWVVQLLGRLFNTVQDVFKLF